MRNKKILILIPDGVGLRNFAYTNFCQLARQRGFDITFWNGTSFDLKAMGYDELRLPEPKIHPMTQVLKTLRIYFDLKRNIRKSGDQIYKKYFFPLPTDTFKKALKSVVMKGYMFAYSPATGSKSVRGKIKVQERKTLSYHNCFEQLKQHQPDLVFCSNQRIVSAIAPILAAQDLGIPTATFIFSWDNLPKATMALEPDHYFVWSDHMKNELMYYHEYISKEQVFVTGTPQFEPHAYMKMMSKEDFYKAYGLDPKRRYICFSGDDVTTSPNDPQYLSDTADAVRKLNSDGGNIGLVFRRCPVDFSNRYDEVLQKNSDIIVALDPKWKRTGEMWNAILPTPEDLELQLNTIAHTDMVINLGSSMVFDYVSFEKPCAYINYDVKDNKQEGWSVESIYKFVHFRSMPSKDAVLWINGADSMASVISKGLSDSRKHVAAAHEWFEKINLHPVSDASSRILDGFESIIGTSANKK